MFVVNMTWSGTTFFHEIYIFFHFMRWNKSHIHSKHLNILYIFLCTNKKNMAIFVEKVLIWNYGIVYSTISLFSVWWTCSNLCVPVWSLIIMKSHPSCRCTNSSASVRSRFRTRSVWPRTFYYGLMMLPITSTRSVVWFTVAIGRHGSHWSWMRVCRRILLRVTTVRDRMVGSKIVSIFIAIWGKNENFWARN